MNDFRTSEHRMDAGLSWLGERRRVVHVGGGESAARALEAVRSAGAHDVIVLHASERECLDDAKSGLIELGHMGPTTARGGELWWGCRAGWDAWPVRTGELPVIVSYFTLGTAYEEEAAGLVATCRALGLEHQVVGVPARGAWEKNCAMKAGFVHDMWRSLGRSVLWVDADARVRRVPELLRGCGADLGVHKATRWQFASGTVYIGATWLGGELLRTWERRCAEDPLTWDQVHLDAAWAEVARRAPLQTCWLPQSYTRIFDRPAEQDGGGEAVIEHFQASRRLKAGVSAGPVRPFRDYDDQTKAARRASRPTDIGFRDEQDDRRAVA